MKKITQNFYQVKAKGAVHRWFTTLCLATVLWVGAVVQVNGQTWLTSAASGNYNTGDGLGYTVSGIGTFYRSTSGGTSTISTDTGSGCNGSTQTIQMTSSLFIFKATTDLNGIVLYGNSGTGGSRTFSAVATASTLNGAYTAVAGTSSATGNLSGTQAVNFCSPSPMTITFGSTIPAGTYFRITLSGNAYIAAIQFTPACTPATISGTATTSVGSTTTLTPSAGGGTWSSGNTSIATVDAGGIVTGVAVGTATITYTLSGCPATKDVTVLGQIKYFRSKANGVWSAAGTWEVSDDGNSGWVTATNAPDANAKGIEIAAGTTVTLDANLTTPLPTVNNTIQVNGTLAASTFTLTLGSNVSVNAGGTLSIAGTAAGQLVTTGKVLTVLGTLTNTNTSSSAITSTASTLLFATASGAGVYNLNGAALQIPAAAWSNGSYYGTAKVGTSAVTPTYSTPAGTYGNIEFAGTASPVKPFIAANNGIAFRNFTITSGTYQMTTGAGPVTVNVTGDFTQTAGTFTQGGYAVTTTLNVGGNFAINGGTYNYATASSNININGNLTVANSSGLTLFAPLTANTLTVNSGTLTVKSGTTLTVQNEVVNNAGANGIIIENNANLIQVNSAAPANQGVVTVKRNSNALKRLDYTIWSSPVSGTQTLAQFSPSTSQSPNRFYTYDTANNQYDNTNVPTTATFDKAAGYLIRMPNDADAVTATPYAGVFTGVLNNGTVSKTISDSGSGYNMIGNPYSSTISADAFMTANSTSIESVLYFWRKTNLASGSAYAVYTPLGGAGTAPSESGVILTPNGVIQVGQGFFVKAKAGATAVSFTNLMRQSVPASTQFFKTKKTDQLDRVWLNLTNTSGVFSQALVGYTANATAGVDGYDGLYFNDSPVALTSNINGAEYAVQGRPAFDASDVVPLNFKTDTAGDYTIAIDHADGVFASGQDVILVDAVAGTETSLKSGSYTFTAPAGTANSRFALKYQKTLGLNDSVFNENNVAVYINKGVVYVNSGAAAIANVKVYDIQGKLLAELKDVKSTSAAISNLKAVNQVLVVKVTAEDGGVVTKKVVN